MATYLDPTATGSGKENFGSSVAVIDTSILVGAPGNSTPGQAHYFFEGNPSKRLAIDDPITPPQPWLTSFGNEVAALGSDAVVAHWLAGDDDNGALYRFAFSFVCGDDIVDPGEQCDDGGTEDGDCCSSTCTFEPSGQACDDENVCTENDECDGNAQCVGAPLDCNDGNECTADACHAVTGCFSTNLTGTSCTNDGNSCTNDVCHGGVCTHPVLGDGTACNDANTCTTPDLCSGGVCVPGACQIQSPCGVACGVNLFCQEPSPGTCACVTE